MSEPGPTSPRQGILFVLSAPSGAGKSTLIHNLRATEPFSFIVSCTTRAPRAGEQDGVDYTFLGVEEFQQRVRAGFFLEHAQVHGSHWYGTPRGDVLRELAAGRDVMLDIDVEGARQVRGHPDPRLRRAVVDIFVMPPGGEELERRLRGRGTESEDQVRVRLETARREMRLWREYSYVILSGGMEEDLQRARAILQAERCRVWRWTGEGA